jgi:hypothetical protein
VLSIITGRVGASLLCYIPPIMGFVTCPQMSCGSLCVCIVCLRGFHHCKDLTLDFLVLVIEQTINFAGLRVDIEDQHGFSGLLLGYCWMVVYC